MFELYEGIKTSPSWTGKKKNLLNRAKRRPDTIHYNPPQRKLIYSLPSQYYKITHALRSCLAGPETTNPHKGHTILRRREYFNFAQLLCVICHASFKFQQISTSIQSRRTSQIVHSEFASTAERTFSHVVYVFSCKTWRAGARG